MRRLHIAASLKVLAKHRHTPGISVAVARDAIQRLAATKTRTREDALLAEDLERVSGLSLADLAELTKQWLPKG